MIGTRLTQYEIIEELGQGGMAKVYRAYQPRMDRYVAVKVIKPSIIEESDIRERFQREARIIARLEHPHMLPVYDFDGGHDPPYIVMRYLEGSTLKEALAGRRLPFDEITYLLRQIGSALDYAHRQGVVHRDIKPSNIMIGQEGNAFVMDFGIARMTGRNTGDGGLTGTGAIIGTPDYMAPEQGYGLAEVDLRADIYSEGVLLFEMTTGQLPFKGKTPMETMLHHLTEPVPSPLDLNPDLPLGLDQVIRTAMAKDPADRYSSVVEFTAEATRVLGDKVAVTPRTLQEVAEESVARTNIRRLEHQEQIEATMAKFSAVRDEPSTVTGPAQQHRTVTALFADAAEYYELVEFESGFEEAQRAVRDLWAQASAMIEDYGGTVFNQTDRDLLALWGAVSAHEDDPELAVLSALNLRDKLHQRVESLIPADEPLPIRIALNTGPVLVDLETESGGYSASGATVNLANRIANDADGLILVTRGTYRQIQGIFDVEEHRPLRVRRAGGMTHVDTFRVNAVKPRAFRLHARGIEGVDTQMIGRRADLEVLQKAFLTTMEDAELQFVTVISPPGLGKSRLLYEFAAWADLRPQSYYIFRGRATPSMTNRPYSLWRDILSFRFEILDSDSPDIVRQKILDKCASLIGPDERLAHLIGYLAGFDFEGSPYLRGDPNELVRQGRRAAREFFQRLTTSHPVLIQLEDIHHADDPSLDLLAEITSNSKDIPLFVVAMARPELHQRRPKWGSGQDFHVSIELRPLGKRDSRELVSEILQKVEEVPRQLRDLLVDRAEGNPYYMEELVKMLIEDRVILKEESENWVVEVSRLKGLRVPPTLISLLQARFDSLLYPEKLTLQRAAVVGRVFYDSAVAALDAADQTHVTDLNGILTALSSREFVFLRETSAFENSSEYIFAQAMMRDLILETLLEDQVATYHKAMAQWLTAQSGQRSGEYDGLIAEHYEAAGENILAAEFLAKACSSAIKLSAYQEGIKSGEKGLALLENSERNEKNTRLMLEIQMTLADVNGILGNYSVAQRLLETALDSARTSGNRRIEANALAHLGRLRGTFIKDRVSNVDYLEQALEINRELDDKPGLIFILRQLGNDAAFISGDLPKGAEYLKQSLELAREIGDMESVANALNSLGVNAWSDGDSEKALNYYLEAIEFAHNLEDKLFLAMVQNNIAWIYLSQGKLDLVQEYVTKAHDYATVAASRSLLSTSLGVQGWLAVRTGRYEEAHEFTQKSAALSREIGDNLGLVISLTCFAWLEGLTGDIYQALEWLGAVQSHDFYRIPGFRRHVDMVLDEICANFPQSEARIALGRGAGQTIDDVIDQILA